MNTVVNPTKDDVKKFCKIIEENLLAAIDRGATVEVSIRQDTHDVVNDIGMRTDVIYIGAKFVAKFRERGF